MYSAEFAEIVAYMKRNLLKQIHFHVFFQRIHFSVPFVCALLIYNRVLHCCPELCAVFLYFSLFPPWLMASKNELWVWDHNIDINSVYWKKKQEILVNIVPVSDRFAKLVSVHPYHHAWVMPCNVMPFPLMPFSVMPLAWCLLAWCLFAWYLFVWCL